MTDRLLEFFRHHANRTGLVLARENRMILELGASRESLQAALTALEAERAIRVLSPLPFLALKLLSLPGNSHPSVRKEQQISSSAAIPHEEVPVSSRAAAATQQEDGGAGEGERLLGEVLRVLGPTADRDEFRAILVGHHPSLIHRALRRVQATKAIRVSRAALFRSLLQKLSH